jgi:hypothetical protein
MSLQTTSAAKAHLVGEQILLDEKTLNKNTPGSNAINSVQFNSYLFMYKLNSPEAYYKVSTSKKKETTTHLKTKYKAKQFM